MPNTIKLRQTYSTLLDEAYKLASLTAVLDGPNELVKQGANANEILIPKMTMQGLANYNKQTGYVNGDVTLEYETRKCDYDRGRMFTIDAMDDIESAGVAFGRLAGEFLRTQVTPELDAWRFSKYAALAENKVAETISDAKAGIKALRTARTAIVNGEAKLDTCVLFISANLKGMLDDLDTTASKKVLEGWGGVVEVPEGRFYDDVTLTAGDAGGFTHAGAKAIEFMVIDKLAAIQNQKHVVPKIITPEANQDADAWKFAYRTVGIAEAYDNKKAGIYVHTATGA